MVKAVLNFLVRFSSSCLVSSSMGVLSASLSTLRRLAPNEVATGPGSIKEHLLI